jgi:hypothetical protein
VSSTQLLAHRLDVYVLASPWRCCPS